MALDGTDVMQERFDRDRELRELPEVDPWGDDRDVQKAAAADRHYRAASSYAGLQSFRGSMPWPWNTPDEHDPSL